MARDEDGVIRVGGTRVTLETVASAFNEGGAPEDITPRYPVLRLPNVYSILGYYLDNRDEIDQHLESQAIQFETERTNSWSRVETEAVRERLRHHQGRNG